MIRSRHRRQQIIGGMNIPAMGGDKSYKKIAWIDKYKNSINEQKLSNKKSIKSLFSPRLG